MVKILEKKGFITGTKKKQGNMPEMTVYSITQSGKALLQKTLLSYFNSPENYFSELALSTILLGRLDRETILQAINNYQDKIKEAIALRKKLISSADIEESRLRRIITENTLNILKANLKTANELITIASDNAAWSSFTAPWWRNEYLQGNQKTYIDKTL